jgi:hypothetical protein
MHQDRNSKARVLDRPMLRCINIFSRLARTPIMLVRRSAGGARA